LIFHLIGNLCPPNLNADFEMFSETPEISKIIVPSLTTAIHLSGLPLPFPIRTPIGLEVLDK
jgi:hypothetical protein